MDSKQQVQQLCSDFLSNQLKQGESLEELSFLGDTDLESVVMRYAHGDCHIWSLALHEVSEDLKPHLVLADDIPIHSFVVNLQTNTALDSNGVHHIESIRQYWSDITGVACDVEEVCHSTIYQLCTPCDDEVAEAVENIAFWYDKTRQHFLN